MSVRTPSEQRLLVVVNEFSTKAKDYYSQLFNPLMSTDWNKSVNEVRTPNNDYDDNLNEIATNLVSGDIVLSFGGDGLANIVTNSVIASGLPEITPVFLPGGNGNDNAMFRYGKKINKFDGVLDLIENGEQKSISTIAVNKRNNTRHALGCIGFGLTAQSSVNMNDVNHRFNKKRSKLPSLLFDAVGVIDAIKHIEPIDYINEKCEIHQVSELSYCNIGRMAKILKIKHEKDEAMLKIEINPEDLTMSILKKLIIENNFKGIKGIKTQSEEFKLLSPAVIHYDGETESISSGTKLNIAHRKNTITTLEFN